MLFLLPCLAISIAFFLSPPELGVFIFVAMIWLTLVWQKGHILPGLAAGLASFALFAIFWPDVTAAFFLGLAPLAAASLWPSRKRKAGIWVLSSGGNGVFAYFFPDDKEAGS